jgi:hypothetical protein
MSAALLAYAVVGAVVLGLILRGRRLRRRHLDALVLAGHWGDVAAQRGTERDHLAWELGQSQRVHAELAADTNRAVRLLLDRIDRIERESTAAVVVALTRVVALSALLAEHQAAADDVDAELQEMLAGGS